MKKSIPVASCVDIVEPASDVPTGKSLLKPQVAILVRTSSTRSRMDVTDEV